MKKKLLSLIMAAATAALSAVVLTGCGDKEYPVEVANYKIEKEPNNIVVLDAPTADIISYIGYDRKIVGRSDEVSQEALKGAPSMGGAEDPDVKKIKAEEAEIVFAADSIKATAKKELTDKDVKVITLQRPETLTEVETNYETLGKILGGKKSGLDEGKQAFKKFKGELEKIRDSIDRVDGAVRPTICYIYLDEQNRLRPLTTGHLGSLLMADYTNCDAINSSEWDTNVNKTFSGVNINYIFYNDDATLEAIKKDDDLKKSTAVISNSMQKIPYENLCCPGQTAIDTLNTMVKFIYGGTASSSPDQPPATQPATQPATKPATQPATQPAAQPATQPATKPAEAAKDLSSQYKVDLNKIDIEKGNDNDDVKAVQQRLEDLGYIKKSEDNVTGYFGDATEQALKDFQKKNGLEQTGEADSKTLKALFMSDAKKA